MSNAGEELQIIVSGGQSLSVGSTYHWTKEILSDTPTFADTVYGLDFGSVAYNSQGWEEVPVDPSTFQGFTPLVEGRWETHASGMLNRIAQSFADDGLVSPDLLHFHTGIPGTSIMKFMVEPDSGIYTDVASGLSNTPVNDFFVVATPTADGTQTGYDYYLNTGSGAFLYERSPAFFTPPEGFANFEIQLQLAYDHAVSLGYSLTDTLIFDWIQGQSDPWVDDPTYGYHYVLDRLLERIDATADRIFGTDVELIAAISQHRGFGAKTVSYDQLKVVTDDADEPYNAIFGTTEYQFQAREPSAPPTETFGGDMSHLSSEGYYMYGQAMGDKIYAALSGNEDPPILMESAVFSSPTEVVISFSGLEGVLVDDGSIFKASSGLQLPDDFHMGFGFTNLSGYQYVGDVLIVGAEVTGDAEVTVTLSQALTGAVRLNLGNHGKDLSHPDYPFVSTADGYGATTLRDSVVAYAAPPSSDRALDDPVIYEYAPIQYIVLDPTANPPPPNGPPVAQADSGLTGQDAVYSANVLANDTDPDGDTLMVTELNGSASGVGQATTLASGAVVILQASGDLDYDPNGAFDGLTAGQTATDSFRYTVSDGNGGTDTALVTLTIEGRDTTPVPTDILIDFETALLGNFPGVEDVAASGLTVIADGSLGGQRLAQTTGFTLTATEEDFDLSALVALSAGGRVRVRVEAFDDGALVGTATINARSSRASEVTFGPEFNSIDTVTVTANGTFFVDNLALTTLRVPDTGGNQPPQAAGDSFATGEADPLVLNPLSNDIDPEGGPLTLVAVDGDPSGAVTLASGAQVSFSSTGSLTYDPNGAFDGLFDGQTAEDSFVYTVADGGGASAQAAVTVTVLGSGTPPPEPTETQLDFEGTAQDGSYTEDAFLFDGVQITTQATGVVSGQQAGQSINGRIALTRADLGAFDLSSATATATTGGRVTLTVEAFAGGVSQGSVTERIFARKETEFTFDNALFANTDRVVFTSAADFILDDVFVFV